MTSFRKEIKKILKSYQCTTKNCESCKYFIDRILSPLSDMSWMPQEKENGITLEKDISYTEFQIEGMIKEEYNKRGFNQALSQVRENFKKGVEGK